MDDWLALETAGFIVLPARVPQAQITEISRLYDVIVSSAAPEDIRIGSTTTRVSRLVNRAPEFDELYLCPQILEECRRIIKQPFELSTMHARTLRPRTPAQELHVDFAGAAPEWPMVGFIWMVDDFTPENGATCFLPASQGLPDQPATSNLVSACGPAGSVIVYNGSVWHGHGPNHTDKARRSIQGAYIRRTEARCTVW